MKKAWRLLVTLPLLVFAACGAQLTDVVVNPAPHALAARPASAVEVFTSQAPAREHTDVTLIEAKDTVDTDGIAQMIEKLRTHAGKLGCDGLVVQQDGHDRIQLRGTCIVYK
jgi:hypothetical protein